MTNLDALIQLITSLSKNERRSFRQGKNSDLDYVVLFDLIERHGPNASEVVKTKFDEMGKGSALNVTVAYLYKILLDRLVLLRQGENTYHALMMQIMKARILFEKSIFSASLDMLAKVKEEARRKEYADILVIASRLELEYLDYLNMPDITEDQLVAKHYEEQDMLRRLNTLSEQSALCELLKHRTIYKGVARSETDKAALNDLIFTEQNLTRKSLKSYEARNRHLLFQSMFFMNIGDGESAADVLMELNQEDMNEKTESSPISYVAVFGNMLENLRTTRRYDQIPGALEKLRGKSHPSVNVRQHIDTLVALYEFLPLLDHGEFQQAKEVMESRECLKPSAICNLGRSLELKILLYEGLTYLGLKDYKNAKRRLVSAIVDSPDTLPIYRILRIANLMVRHKMHDTDYIQSETRSLKREIARSPRPYRMEHLILEVVGKDSFGMMTTNRREQFWKKIQPRLEELRGDVFEKQLLKIFDFSAWIESEILRVSFSETLRRNLTLP